MNANAFIESCGGSMETWRLIPVDEAHEGVKRAVKLVAGHTAASSISGGAISAAGNMALAGDVMEARSRYRDVAKKKSASKDDVAAARKAYHRAQAKAALRGFGSGATYGAVAGLGRGTSAAIIDRVKRDTSSSGW